MSKERENEIRQMSREAQEAFLVELRQKYGSLPVAQNQSLPVHKAAKLVAANEQIDLLEKLLRVSE